MRLSPLLPWEFEDRDGVKWDFLVQSMVWEWRLSNENQSRTKILFAWCLSITFFVTLILKICYNLTKTSFILRYIKRGIFYLIWLAWHVLCLKMEHIEFLFYIQNSKHLGQHKCYSEPSWDWVFNLKTQRSKCMLKQNVATRYIDQRMIEASVAVKIVNDTFLASAKKRSSVKVSSGNWGKLLLS